MDTDSLTKFGNAELAAFLWKRLRLEDPLDPPLDRATRVEPPEDFIIRAMLAARGTEFRQRVVSAIVANLERLTRLSRRELDDVTWEQFASLSFLAAATADPSLARPLYLAVVGCLLGGACPESAEPALFHMLDAIASLQRDSALAPFWESLWRELPSARLKSVAFYGLCRADSVKALSLLPELVEAPGVDLPLISWYLATEGPGISEFGRAAGRLTELQRERLRDALRQAGAEEELLRQFDLESGTDLSSSGFRFPVRRPSNEQAAYQAPQLAA